MELQLHRVDLLQTAAAAPGALVVSSAARCPASNPLHGLSQPAGTRLLHVRAPASCQL